MSTFTKNGNIVATTGSLGNAPIRNGAAGPWWDEKPEPLEFLKSQLKQLEARISEQKEFIEKVKVEFQENMIVANSYENELRKKLQDYRFAIEKLERNK